MEALSWFDFTDHRWLGAPSGVIDDDMNPKPVYHTLHRLMHKEWSSDQTSLTNAEGVTGASLFCGDYEITVEADGLRKTFTRTLSRESFYAGGGSVTWDFAL